MRRCLTVVTLCCGLLNVASAWADEPNESIERWQAREGLGKARITMREAVETALGRYPEGKAVEAEFEIEQGKPQFEVEVVLGAKHQEIHVDANDGSIMKVDTEDSEESSQETSENEMAKADTALLSALATAAREVPNGKPFEVESGREHGKLVYEFEFLDHEKVVKIDVDAATGKVVK